MEFLKAILGEELYKQVETAIFSHNGNEANKDNQVKLANLATGEYVGKGKYDALNDMLKGRETELNTANELIAGLKKSEKGNEELQTKINTYEQQIVTLQAQLKQTQIDGEVNVALLAAGVKPEDIDYVTFKLKAKGDLDIGEDGKIKGMDDKIAALKTQLPAHFTAASKKNVLENRLPDADPGDKVVTKEEFDRMGYQSRVEFKKNNPEQYSQLTK
jgi:hypothetical protein